MVKKTLHTKAGAGSKNEDGFDRLAHMMKEEFDDVRKEIYDSAEETKHVLRTEIHELEENLQYCLAIISTDINRRLGMVEPQVRNHGRRVKKLESART